MRYTFQTESEKVAKARGVDLPLSMRDSIVVCKFLEGMKVAEAKKYLEGVVTKNNPIPYSRYLHGVSHRGNIGPGRYPVKVSKEILKVLENLEANAENQDLDTDELVIISILAKKGRTVKRYMPRAQGRSAPFFKRRVHIEIIAKEAE